jgi:molybdate transport system ATP-binding protein
MQVKRGAFVLQATFSQYPGITGIYGASGSGKSTLLSAVAGLLRINQGTIRVGDDVLDDTDKGLHVPIQQRRIGLVFQDGLLFPHLQGEANLRYGERVTGSSLSRIPYAQIVELLRLQPLLARYPTSMSGGERQRLALGRALLANPQLLLLDEPLNAVDRIHRAEILDGLITIQQRYDLPILYVSHDLGEILRLTNQLLLLDQGQIKGHGRFTDLAHDPSTGGLLIDPVVLTRLAATKLPQ